MKNSKIIIAILVVLWYSIIFGVAVPNLISNKSDFAPMIGAGLAIIHVVGPILWFNREKKEQKVV